MSERVEEILLKKFGGSVKTVLEFKASLIAAGFARGGLRCLLIAGSLKTYSR